MAKRSKLKVRRGDHLRALLTDTAPDEVPIIFNNDNLYINTKEKDNFSEKSRELLDAIMWNNTKNYTIPYRYRVSKTATATRRLSLLHPNAQLDICDFYQEFEHLICYYNTLSPYSIRAPYKISSSVYESNPSEGAAKYKPGLVATDKTDKVHKHPETFFAYKQYSMLHRFFSSERFLRLEQAYSTMWIGDVSKCFHSIYTHSIAWAVRGRDQSKQALGSRTFGSAFDKLAQSQNYNETNGICIGSEMSRIFAEVIFQAIDCEVHHLAKELDLIQGEHYDCARYVDDIHIFSKDDVTASQIYALYDRALGAYNLHFNEGKLQKYNRPFNTEKGIAINNASSALARFDDTIISYVDEGDETYAIPKQVRSASNVKLALVRDLKSASGVDGLGYALISNYALAGLCERIERVILAYNKVPISKRPHETMYFKTISLLLEASFFLFSVHPTASSSLKLSKAILLSSNFVKSEVNSRHAHLTELLFLKCTELAKSTGSDLGSSPHPHIHIEFLNVYLAVTSIADQVPMTEDFIWTYVLRLDDRKKRVEYFSLICGLFIIKNQTSFNDLKKKLKVLVTEVFTEGESLANCSEKAHMLLDIVACPYLDLKYRASILRAAYKTMGFVTDSIDFKPICSELESKPWFTSWTDVNLERLISRKQLRRAY